MNNPKNINFVSNRQGMSLIQVVIAMGITAMIGLASLQMINTMNKASTRSDIKFNSDSLGSMSKSLIYNELTCTPAISKSTITSGSVELPIEFDFGQVKLKAAEVLSNYSLKIDQIAIRNLVQSGVNTTTNNRSYIGEVYVKESMTKDTSGGNSLKEKSYGSVNLLTDQNGQIIRCAGDAAAIAKILNPTSTPTGNNNGNTLTGGSGINIQTVLSDPGIVAASTACAGELQCIVQDWFVRNGDTRATPWTGNPNDTAGKEAYYKQQAQAWINQAQQSSSSANGGTTWESIATSYKDISSSGLYSKAVIDEYIKTQAPGNDNYLDQIISGVSAAQDYYSADVITDYIAANPNTWEGAASVVNAFAADPPSNTTSTLSDLISQATSQYSNEQIQAYFDSGKTLQDAINEGHIK